MSEPYVHIYTAAKQSAAHFFDTSFDPPMEVTLKRRHVFTDCCHRLRLATNCTVQTYYDGWRFWCEKDKGCKCPKLAAAKARREFRNRSAGQKRRWKTGANEMTDPTPSVPDLIAQLAQCFKIAGADCDGNEDWRIAPRAVRAVTDLRRDYDEACNEADALRTQLAADPCVRHACKRVRVEMQAEIDEARRDAERYRWLRAPENECNVEIPTQDSGYLLPGHAESLDATIDAAIGATNEG